MPRIQKSKIFEVYESYRGQNRRILYTQNLTPGKTVYDESIITENNIEYREWNPRKSKLAAAIQKDTNNIFIRANNTILYLGSSTGTTISHVSDIVGSKGFIFAVDSAPRVMRELVFIAEHRKNIAPILANANKPADYQDKVSSVDVVYQDIAQRNQLQIFLKNVNQFLKKDGYALLIVKANSIDITRKPKAIFNELRQDLEKEMTIIDYKILEPLQLGHYIFICKKK